MAEKSTIAKMYDDLVNALDGIVERDYIFLGGRPDIKEPELENEEVHRHRASCRNRGYGFRKPQVPSDYGRRFLPDFCGKEEPDVQGQHAFRLHGGGDGQVPYTW